MATVRTVGGLPWQLVQVKYKSTVPLLWVIPPGPVQTWQLAHVPGVTDSAMCVPEAGGLPWQLVQLLSGFLYPLILVIWPEVINPFPYRSLRAELMSPVTVPLLKTASIESTISCLA